MHRSLALAAALLLTAAPAALAQPGERSLPDTPAGVRATALLDALRGSEADRLAFLDEALAGELRRSRSDGEWVRLLNGLSADLDGAERVGVRMGGPHSIALAYRTAGAETLRISVEVAGSEPHGIRRLGVEAGEGPGPSIRFDSWDELDARLDEMETRGRFAGVVLAASGGEIRFHRAYGLAREEPERAVRLDTRFNVGSLMKPLTGTLILRLAQEGRVDLDAPVGTYVDGLRPRVAENVTLLHLLRHRSGLGDYLGLAAYREDPDRFRTVDDLMALVREQPLEFEPGTEQRYSNSGFVLLGAVVEAVTGRSYGRVLDEWIFHPAGMERTSLEGLGADPNTALPYRRTEGGGLESVADRHGAIGSPAGGGFSTARDLYRFARAVLDDRLLEPEWTDLLLAGYDRDLVRREGRVGAGWGGGGPGVNATLEVEPDGTVVAVVANRDPPAASGVGVSVARWLRR